MKFKLWLFENFENAGIFINTPRGKKTYSVKKLADWANKNTKPVKVSIDELKKTISQTEGSGYSALVDTLPPENDPEYVRSINSNTNYPIIIIREKGETWVGDGNHRIMKARLTNQNQLPAYILDAATLPPPESELFN